MTRLLTTALSLFVVAAISSPPAVVAEGAALPEHVIFRTSQTVTTGLGGLSAMDARCQAKAAAAGLDGTWMALLSDSAHGARQRLADAGVEGPFYDNCGSCAAGPRQLAESLDDLFDGSVAATLVFDELGKSVPSTMESWTATLADGSYAGSSYDDWTSFRGGARTGKHAATGSAWLSWVERSGVASHSLYCVRTGLEPASPPPAEPGHVHTIFVS